MPKATVSTETERYDLKSAPPDGYVVIKRMSYGQMLERQGLAAKIMMQADKKSARGDASATMEFAQQKVFLYELAHCVVDHNLMDENDQLLDFRQPATLTRLDPKIGAEIDKIISDLHQFDEDLEGNSSAVLEPSS